MTEKIIPYEKSFASHNKAVYWSNKNILKPEQVYLKTDKKYWFNCNLCNHEFEKKPLNLAMRENEWCPYCSCESRYKLCDDEKCNFCFENSFASNPKSKLLDKSNNINPRFLNKCSGEKYLFNCDNCEHSFSKRISNITRGVWCPFCSNRELCDNLKCNLCFKNSLQSSKISNLFSSKNNISPRFVFKNSNNKYIFECNICHNDFKKTVATIKNNCYCSKCINKTEKKLFDFLVILYPIVIYQYKIDWCKNNKTNLFLPFDYCLEEFKIIIELDGK